MASKRQVYLILLRRKFITFAAKESTGLEDPKGSAKQPPPQRLTTGQSREYSMFYNNHSLFATHSSTSI